MKAFSDHVARFWYSYLFSCHSY